MGTVLIGYDTESGAVGEGLARFGDLRHSPYRFALDTDSTVQALEVMTDVHRDVGVNGTLFICGRTLVHSMDAVKQADATGLFDIQQHTYSHVPFREIVYQPEPGVTATIPETPPAALREELRFSSQLIRDHLGHDCLGLRTPFGYYRGLRGRPDLLEHVRATGLRYVTSWGRNEENANPTPLEVQPFTYEEEGFPDILELPFQFWLDGVWFDQYGYDTGDAYRQAMEGVVDEVARRDVVFGACFHDWTLIAADERRVGWLRGFLAYAKERVPVMTYTEYWRERTGSASRSATCFP
jgi:peptidoglycan/xylan/chitin deacetylase (PgdA/CDA1 family)